jgi:hypothetical protein
MKHGGKTCFVIVKMCFFLAKIHLFCEIKKLERKKKNPVLQTVNPQPSVPPSIGSSGQSESAPTSTPST